MTDIILLCGRCAEMPINKKCDCECHKQPGLMPGKHYRVTDDHKKFKLDTSYDWIKDEGNAV